VDLCAQYKITIWFRAKKWKKYVDVRVMLWIYYVHKIESQYDSIYKKMKEKMLMLELLWFHIVNESCRYSYCKWVMLRMFSLYDSFRCARVLWMRRMVNPQQNSNVHNRTLHPQHPQQNSTSATSTTELYTTSTTEL